MASEDPLETSNNSNQVIVKQVYKSSTHRHLLSPDYHQSSNPQIAAKKRIEQSPSQAISNQIYQVDSATEKSSLYPPYMKSKLDQLQKDSPEKNVLKRRIVQPTNSQPMTNNIIKVPVAYTSA